MFTLQSINQLLNYLLFFELLFLNIYLFGRKASIINHIPKWSYWTIRIFISIMTAGALFASLRDPIILWQQFMRNLGTTVVVGWALSFHYYYIIKRPTIPEKKSTTTSKTTKKPATVSKSTKKPVTKTAKPRISK